MVKSGAQQQHEHSRSHRANPDGLPPAKPGLELSDVACSIDAALAVVGDRWSILILRDMFKGIRRFEEVQRDLDIPRAVLTDRLRRLVETGVLERRRYQHRPERFEYRLTDMGRELSPILVSLMHWGDKWLGDGDPPVSLVHQPCGTPVTLDYYCWECSASFPATEIRNLNSFNEEGGHS